MAGDPALRGDRSGAKVKAVSPAATRLWRVTSSLLVQRRSNQEESTPGREPAGCASRSPALLGQVGAAHNSLRSDTWAAFFPPGLRCSVRFTGWNGNGNSNATATATATATAARGAWIGLASRRIRARAALDKHCALAAAAVHGRCRDLIGGSYLRERPVAVLPGWVFRAGRAGGYRPHPESCCGTAPENRCRVCRMRLLGLRLRHNDSRRRCIRPKGAADLKPRRTSYPGCPGQAAHGCAAAASTGMDVRPSGDPDTRGAAAPSGADALPQDRKTASRKRHPGRLCSDGGVACPGGHSLAPATCCALRLPARQPPWFQGTPRVCR